MANAKQCDRCGAFYIEREATAYEAAIKASENLVKFLVDPKSIKSETQCVIERVIDLCPDCSKSLTKWLNKREDSNE